MVDWGKLFKFCPPKQNTQCQQGLAACNEQVAGLKTKLAEAVIALSTTTTNLQECNSSHGASLIAIIKERDGLLAQLAKSRTPFPPDIKFEPYGSLDAPQIQWVKSAIENTGMSGVLTEGKVREIRIVDNVAAHVPNCPANALASITSIATGSEPPYMVIFLLPKGWMPGWDLPGTVIHEAVHSWQMVNGCTAGVIELSAYMVQQVFEWRYCALIGVEPRNLFKVRPGAIGLL